MTTPTKGINLDTNLSVFFNDPAATVISANAAITAANDNAEANNLSELTNDKAISAVVSTAIDAIKAIIVPILDAAFLVDAVSNAIIADNATTASVPLTRFSMSTIPRSTAITANIPIAMDMAKSAAANFDVPCAFDATARSPETIKPRTTIPARPFPSSDHFILAISLMIPVSISIAAAIANNIPPSLGTSFPPSLVIKTNNVINTRRAPRPVAPFPISPHDIPAINFMTAVMIVSATAIFKSIDPTLLELLPAIAETAIKASANNSRTKITANPFSISLVPMLDTNFITPMSIKSAIENFSIIDPSLSAFCAALPLTSFPYADIKTIRAPIIPTIPRKPCVACHRLSDPICLTTCARISNDAEIPIKPSDIAPNFMEPTSITLDSLDNPMTTTTSPAKIPTIAPSTPTAVHNLLGSINVSAITAATSTVIANARSLIAFSLILKDRDLKYFPSPPSASPNPVRTSPMPSIGLASLSIALANFTME